MKALFKDRAVGKTLFAIVLLALGLIAAWGLCVNLSRDLSLWVLGRRVTAEVVDSWYDATEYFTESGNREVEMRYFVRYAFTTPRGKTFFGTSELGAYEWSSSPVGAEIDVIYFVLYPSHNRLDDTRFIPVLLVAYFPLAALAFFGLGGGVYLMRDARTYASVPSLRDILDGG